LHRAGFAAKFVLIVAGVSDVLPTRTVTFW
jgi:hypothetical protein